MYSRISLLLICSVLLLSNSCKKETTTEALEQRIDWSAAHNFYLENITLALSYIDSLQTVQSSDIKAKTYFIKAREAFKQAEPFASYLSPEVGHQANGPALPRLTDDTQKVLQPIGFQKLEESIYEGGVSETQYTEEVQLTKGLLSVLKASIEKRDLNAQRFFIATHQQLMRILSFGITGFDTPVSELGLNETQISLNSLVQVYELSLQNTVQTVDAELDKKFKNEVASAVAFIEKNKDFASFDRYTFLRDYFNPITRSWVAIRKVSNIWEPVTNKPFNFDAPTFFERDAFNVDFFRQATNSNPTQQQIDLGARLFFDKKVSKGETMACATCHIPENAYADGLKLNFSNAGALLKRNTPTLINSIFQQGFFWDGRAPDMMSQISGVFTNDAEFDSAVHEFSDAILKDSSYVDAFKEVFGERKWTNDEVIKSLSAYISTLNSFDSKFDKNMRGEEDTFTSAEKQGMNLFMGKALCATCHFMPLTGGTVPPFFTETEKEVIGVPKTAANKTIDSDSGFYFMYEEPMQFGMFKTPTVRNAAVTAPYMHNGVYETLAQVMDFYNKGGGAGLGFDLPHQTLPFDNLQLTEDELQSLVAFVETLTAIPVLQKE
ncbi:cytochrome c peroxidase [Leeuwenhoekiella sp. W20_SRS_FM14]|uniref:cytochrome c peroxidase n=1 Tax=Leeuwenhoekiella sp. W20_SRS_FM14 TaxID=3240270 RepID=UPI003F959484